MEGFRKLGHIIIIVLYIIYLVTDTLQESSTCDDIGWMSDRVREFCSIDKDSIVDLSCSQLWGKVNPVSEYLQFLLLCADQPKQC